QIHIPADLSLRPCAFNRQGQFHKKELPEGIIAELRRLFPPAKEWNVIDAEWMKEDDKLYVFDFLKKDGELLSRLTYPERWALLPRDYISPHISTLGMFKTLDKCLE